MSLRVDIDDAIQVGCHHDWLHVVRPSKPMSFLNAVGRQRQRRRWLRQYFETTTCTTCSRSTFWWEKCLCQR